MKRKDNLYNSIFEYSNIKETYNEVCKNTRNKRKVAKFRDQKTSNISYIHEMLKNENYIPKKYDKFIIYEPKERLIVSQDMIDKTVNHLVARYILYPALLPSLLDSNVASRKNMGTKRGLELAKKYNNICKVKFKEYYILKCDISKFFASIDHEILKGKIAKKIKDDKALNIINTIINSEDTGISIGTMTSQVFAIFYLNDLDHFIKEDLKINYYVRYQDDFLLFHESKEYLKYCLERITKFLNKEKLKLNNKTRIYKNTNNFTFLGQTQKNKYSRYRNVKRKLKARYKSFKKEKITLQSMSCSLICYKNLTKKNNLNKCIIKNDHPT